MIIGVVIPRGGEFGSVRVSPFVPKE